MDRLLVEICPFILVEVVRNPPLSRKKNDADRANPLPNSAFGKDHQLAKISLLVSIFLRFMDN